MKILDRYIGRTVVGAILTVAAVLVLVFSFFNLIDELDDVGQGSYGVAQALLFVALSMPRLVYELLPMAALIGALAALSGMVGNGELTVIRAAGVPLWRVVMAVMKSGMLVLAFAVLVGELVAPVSEQHAANMRSVAITAQIALKTANGYWARDGSNYVNIRRILPGDQVEDIFIYEFDQRNRLAVGTRAARAYYADGRWILEDITQTRFEGERVTRRVIRTAAWESLLRPELINIVVLKPQSLSMIDLVGYIRWLRGNGQDAQRYQQALWVKMVYPLATAVMVFLAVPMVLGSQRGSNLGQRILAGVFVGLAFHIVNQGAGHLGVVLELNPAVAVTMPTLVTFGIAMLLMRRVR